MAIVVAAFLAIGAAPAQAEPALAIVPGNVLIRFDTQTPSAIVSAQAVSGLAANQSIRGIDVRPATGQLYATSVVAGSANNSVVQTYTIDPATAVATFVGQSAAALPGAGDVASGYDFNPGALNGNVVDRMRYVNANDENARFNPNNGALAGNDTDLTPALTTDVIAAAYDRNSSGTIGTTLYEIDRNSSSLAMQGGPSGGPSPNNGLVTDLGSLGIVLSPGADAGFDISATGAAFAAMTDNGSGVTGLYSFNLVSGGAVATLVGAIGNGATQVRSLAILQPDRDGDGVRDAADNCPAVANADQADLDADGSGDPCDADEDGDGLSNAVEIAIRSNPRSTNSDGDGVGDGADACPVLPGALPNGCPDVTLPETAITKGPAKRTRKRTATLRFAAGEPGSSFACRLDGGAFKPCGSPRTYRGLKRSRHSFEVRAIDAAGNLDPTPATRTWTVTKKQAAKRRR